MSDTPTAAVLAAPAVQTVTDAQGRVITLRKIGALQKFKLFKACGENAKSPPYLGMAMLASAVAEIDGNPIIQPTTEQQLDALVNKLGDDGLEAIGAAMGGAEATGDEVVEASKNL